MPRHAAHQPERHQQRRDEKHERPRRQQGGLDEFPAEYGLFRHRQRQQEDRLTVAEQVGIADDEIAQQQQPEQKRKQHIHEPLRQHRAEAGKLGNEPHPVEEQLERQEQIAGEKERDETGEQPRLFAHGQQPPPTVKRVHAHEQPERGRRATGFELGKLFRHRGKIAAKCSPGNAANRSPCQVPA